MSSAVGNTTPRLDVLIERVGNVQSTVDETARLVADLSKRLQTFETTEVREHAVMDNRITAAHGRLDQQRQSLDDHEKRLDGMDKAVQPLVMMYKVVAFLGSALILSVIALIWSMITGQVQVVFP